MEPSKKYTIYVNRQMGSNHNSPPQSSGNFQQSGKRSQFLQQVSTGAS